MATDIAVTGIGCLTAFGRGPEVLYSGTLAGQEMIRPISRFDASRYLSDLAGEVPRGAVEETLSSRILKRTDRFTHLALSAAHDALVDAGIHIDENTDGDRVGVTIGNVLGGWEFAERELRNLWARGPRSVSPYQATAWFPTAAQGNITILNSIRGPSRTFVVDRASSAYALLEGVRMIRRDHADVVLVGGAEAPISPYGWLSLQTSGYVARHTTDSESPSVFRPYDRRHQGSTFGEGAGFLVLERDTHARTREARVHGWIQGWGSSTDGYMPYYTVEPSGQVYSRAIADAVSQASASSKNLGVVFPQGSGLPMEDVTELRALSAAFGQQIDEIPVSVPKPLFGHLLGGSFALDVILALWSLHQRTIAPVANLEAVAPGLNGDVDLVRTNRPMRASDTSALVTSRGLGGSNVAVVVGIYPPPKKR